MEFHKTSRQREAISLLASPPKHICLEGGSRSGKSFIICYALIVRACKERSRHAILRLNFNSLKRSIWLDTFPKVLRLAFPDLKVRFHKTDYIAMFPNGSEIHFCGLDDGQRTEKILGLEFSSLFFNEISQIPYSSVQIALSRLAEKNGLKKKAYYDQNPGKKSSWPYWLFNKKLNPVDEEPVKNPDDYASMLMNPGDNLENIDDEYIALLESMPETDRQRFLLGEYQDQSDGQAYYAFSRESHVRPVERRPGTIFLGLDFNVNPMTCVVGQYVDNTVYIVDEGYLENSDTFKMSIEMKSRGYGGARVIPDSTGRNRKTSGQSDFQILKDEGFVIESTHNPFVTDRVNNVNRLLSSGRIVIDPRCKKLINDLEKVSWKDNKLDQSGANKMLTHISDALGYMCWKLDPFSKPEMRVRSDVR